MKTYYQIKTLGKFAEEDNWQEGCAPNTTRAWEVPQEFNGPTPEDVIAQVAKFVGCAIGGKDNGVERNACDEPGRVDFAVTENADGAPMSKREVEAWKEGRCKAWYCVYTGYMKKITEEVAKL